MNFDFIFDFPFWLSFVYFYIAIFFAFYIPVDVVLRKVQLNLFQRIVICFSIGMVFWTWQGYIFGYIGVRWMSYVYLFFFFIAWIRTKSYQKLKTIFPLRIKFTKIDVLIFALIIIGSIIQVSMVWFTGVNSLHGIYFCCADASADWYHLAITNELIHHIPPFDSEMSGVYLTNYHYWSDLVMAELIRVFRLPLLHTEFQYASIFIAFCLGFSAIVFGQLLRLKKTFILFLVFFLYFGGDFIYVIQFLSQRRIDLSMGPLENGSSLLINTPRAFAIIGFFGGLNLLIRWIKNKQIYLGIIVALVMGSLVGFKVYVGIFAISGLLFLGIYYLIHKEWKMVVPCIGALLFSLLAYLPTNSGSGTLFFTGFWRFEEFMIQPKLGLSHLVLALKVYEAHHSVFRIAEYEAIFISLFILAEFGPKLFGLVQNKKSLFLIPFEVHVFLIPALVVNTLIGLFFQQNSGGSNSFNFLVTVYIVLSIYTALACYYWIPRLSFLPKILIFILIIFSNLSRPLYQEVINIRNIMTMQPVLENSDLDALRFVKNNTPQNAVVMSYQAQYASFIAERPVFLGDFGIEESHTIDTHPRRNAIQTILTSKNKNKVKELLLKNNISYIYLPVSESLISTASGKLLKKVYQNKKIQILKVLLD